MVSLGQIYGDILYYATSMFDLYHKGLNYSRPEPYYFWFYYFSMNFVWIVIPGSKCQSWRFGSSSAHLSEVLLYSSVSTTSKAFQALAREASPQNASGSLKKRN